MVCPIYSYFSLPALPYQLRMFHWISFIVMIAVSGFIQGWLPLKDMDTSLLRLHPLCSSGLCTEKPLSNIGLLNTSC